MRLAAGQGVVGNLVVGVAVRLEKVDGLIKEVGVAVFVRIEFAGLVTCQEISVLFVG